MSMLLNPPSCGGIEAAPSANGASLRILLVQHCSGISGSTISGHLIASGMRQAGWAVDVAFGFDGPYRSRYEEIGCRTHVVPHKNWLRAKRIDRSLRCIAAEWRNARAFERLIDQTRPEVVYINSLVSLAAAVAARRKGVPCVWHVRELFDDVGGEMRVPPAGGKMLVRAMLNRYSDYRVALSQTVKGAVLDGLSNVVVIPNAAADAFFQDEQDQESTREQFSLKAGVPIVGVPATLRPVKGIEFFLDAAACLHKSLPACQFAITGSGDAKYETSLRQQARELGLESSICWLNTITDMPSFYRACDVICVPSRSESFGRTAIEAFACGTPLVASAVGGLREIVEDGVNGLLVDYGDAIGLAERLGALLVDKKWQRRLATQGRQDADAQYTERCYQTAVNRIVERCLHGSASELRKT